MLKVLILLIAFLFAISTYILKPILAGGDKVRGDNGQGTVVQTCITPISESVDSDDNSVCMWED
jgi:hypothetical protein